MQPFHTRHPTNARIRMRVRIDDPPTDTHIPVTTATHDELTLAIDADAELAPENLTVGHWYRLNDAVVGDADATHDLRITAQTTVDEQGDTVNDWLGGLTDTPPGTLGVQSGPAGGLRDEDESNQESETQATDDERKEEITCPECGGELSPAESRDETVCENCGLVVEEDTSDHGPESRTFDQQETNEKSRVDAPTTQTMHDKGLTSTIDWKDKDAYGDQMSANYSQSYMAESGVDAMDWTSDEIAEPDEMLGFATGGGKDIQNFRDHIKEGLLPHPDAITYEGLFYDYYFDTGHRRDRDSLFYPTYAQAITDHPVTGEQEHYLSVGLASNLTEDMLERPPLDLMAVVDVSGSMDGHFTEYYYDEHGRKHTVEDETCERKIEAARAALADLTEHFRPDDRFGVVLYNHQTKVAKPIRDVQETDMDAIRDAIRELEAAGSTDLEAGFDEAVTHLTDHVDMEMDERESRVLFITDAMPNEGRTSVDALTSAFARAADQGVHTSFIGVGIDANPELVDALSGIRGANHYFMQSADEFTGRMVDEFPYMVTPLVFDLTLTVEGDGYDVKAVYGSPNADQTTGDVMQVETLFPSPSEDGESRGGVILVKLAEQEGASEIRLSCSWEERDGTEDADVIRVDVPDTPPEHFDTPAIRKAVLLARYGELLRDWLTDAHARSDDVPTDHDASEGCCHPLDSRPPGESNDELTRWERQSAVLVVPDTYQERFTAFHDHVTAEMEVIDDPDLERELDVLDTLIDA